MFYAIIFFGIIVGTVFFAFIGCVVDNFFDAIIEKMDAKQKY